MNNATAITLKSQLKSNLPQKYIHILQSLLNAPLLLEKYNTQRILRVAPDKPSFLDISILEMLQMQYSSYSLPDYGYDKHSLEIRGAERAAQILRFPGVQKAHSFLEIGCSDGMVCSSLCSKGKKTTAVDINDAYFDKRALSEDVNFFQMDATALKFENESFDFVFSYDSFEHFSSPENALREAVRVTKKNGHIYLEFGPLYYSPFGAHASAVKVPYWPVLFPKDVIDNFVAQKKLHPPVNHTHVNKYSLEDYRKIWENFSHVLKKLIYYEKSCLSHLNLIRTYPTCFKGKSNLLGSFVVDRISVLFQKTT
jgi:ubiquinone/menaquinone biosynthesis C-methylase UbiE